MARLLTLGALVVTALIVQLTVLDLLPFPSGIAPDLVLLVVVAIALTNGPLPGLVAGFAAGLALDLAPPASHAVGAYALVFCLTGYACGRAAGEIDRSAFLPLAAMALGVVCGSVLYTVVGATFGEPGVTWAAARNVLPLSLAYDVLLSPFVLYLVLRLTRLAGQQAGEPAVALGRAGSAAAGAAGSGAVSKNPPREPRLRLGMGGPASRIGTGATGLLTANGRSADGWPGGAGITAWPGRRQSPLPRFRFGQAKPPARAAGLRPARPPRLRLRQSARTGAPASPAPGVFSGGSLAGGAQVRLRLGTSRASRLRSRTGRVFGLWSHGRQPARPKFTAAQPSSRSFGPGGSATGPAGLARSGARPLPAGRYGPGRPGLARFLRAPRLRRALGRPRMSSTRPGAPRLAGGRSGGPRLGRSGSGGYRPTGARPLRPRTPRAGWMRRSGAMAGFRRSWLSGLRPRGGWQAIWRLGGRRKGGFR